MFGFFKKTQLPQEAPKKELHAQAKIIPNTPLEICVPEGVRLEEAPKFSGKTISFLVASDNDLTTIEYDASSGRIYSNDVELKQFLMLVDENQQMEKLFSQCRAILFSATEEKSLGNLACIQQGNLYSFSVHELSHHPNIKWKLHRTVRPIDIEPYGPNNAFKPTLDK